MLSELAPLTGFGPSGDSAGGVGVQGAADFFRLVSAQLQAQDPLEPVDETQFLGQIAQFAQLEESSTTNRRLETLVLLQESIAGLQQMTEGVQLIGQEVEYLDPESGETVSGVVRAVRAEDGLVVADVDGVTVPFTWFQAVLGTADED